MKQSAQAMPIASVQSICEQCGSEDDGFEIFKTQDSYGMTTRPIARAIKANYRNT
jgi:hypothetical protein